MPNFQKYLKELALKIKRGDKFTYLWVISLFVLLCSGAAIIFSMPKYSNLLVKNTNALNKNNQYLLAPSLPILRDSEPGAALEITFDLEKNPLSQTIFRLNSDLCLREIFVNNVRVDLNSQIPTYRQRNDQSDILYGFCSPDKFATVDLGKYLKDGDNKIKLDIFNDGGGFGFNMGWSHRDLGLNLYLAFFVSSGIILLFIALDKFKLPPFLSAIFIFSVLFKVFITYQAEFFEYSVDFEGTGHLGYINEIREKLKIPNPRDGWQYSQSPLFYILAGVMGRVVDFFQLPNFQNFLLLQSVFNYSIFSLFGLKTMMLFIRQKCQQVLIGANLCLWPFLLFDVSRISNEILFYTFSGITLYFACKFWTTAQKNHNLIYWGAFFGCLAVLTKTTSAFLFIFLFFVVLSKELLFHTVIFNNKTAIENVKFNLSKYITNFGPYLLKLFITTSVILLIGIFGIGISFSRNYFQIQQDKIDCKCDFSNHNLFVGNINGLSSAFIVNVGVQHFLTLNIDRFLHTHITAIWPNSNDPLKDSGRGYYWETLFQSAISQEIVYKEPFHQNIIKSLKFLFLILLMFMVITATKLSKKDWLLLYPLIIFLIMGLGMGLNYGLKYPYTVNMMFRFIAPILIPFIILIGYGLNTQKVKSIGHIVLGGVLVLIPLLSILMYTVQL